MLTISQNGLNIIEFFEGFSATVYKDPAGVLTVGFGHTGADVHALAPLTRSEAQNLLKKDLAHFEAAVTRLVKVPVNQDQTDALLSLCYNIGVDHFSKSLTLKHLNQGNYAEAADCFKYWCKAGGVELEGLVKRRAAEASLFKGPPADYTSSDFDLGAALDILGTLP